MTAYELAIKLEMRSINYTYHGFYNKEAAALLRKQAKQIEVLEAKFVELENASLDLCNKVEKAIKIESYVAKTI
jgi:hypothetical protein